MSLDNFFDEMERLNQRCLVNMPCTFVRTERIVSVILDRRYKSVVQKYYPQYEIIDGPTEIVVTV